MQWGALDWNGVAGPQRYRKIAVNGRPICEAEPHGWEEKDREEERHCIDALTLQLRHNVSDVYVSLMRGDFALLVRRNAFAFAAPLSEAGSAFYPELPFGNCWFSGLAASLCRMDGGWGDIPLWRAIDEEGSLHWFVDGKDGSLIPLPSTGTDHDSRTVRLCRRDEGWILERGFGTRLVFEEEPSVRVQGASGDRRYHRLRHVTDSRQLRIDYRFESGTAGLVPDRVVHRDRSVEVHRGPDGLVRRVVEPGNEIHYEYEPSRIPEGLPLLSRYYRQKPEQGMAPCRYAYEEKEGASHQGGPRLHVALTEITDEWGNTHRFAYEHDFDAGGRRAGVARVDPQGPIRIKEVDLPGGVGKSVFTSYGKETDRPVVFVADACGHGRAYSFDRRTVCAVPTESGAPISFAGWSSMEVIYLQGKGHRFDAGAGRIVPSLFNRRLLHEKFRFDFEAGLALTEAEDTEGNVTRFECGSPLDLARVGAFYQRHGRVTRSIDPTGGEKRFEYDPCLGRKTRTRDELGRWKVTELEPETGGGPLGVRLRERRGLDRR